MEDGERTAAVVTDVGDHAEAHVPALSTAAPERTGAPDDRRTALTTLMQAHGKAILGYCLRVTRDRSQAEDLTQQVFLEAYRDLERFQGRSSPRSWLFSIASHRCIDALRSERRRSQRIVPDDDTADEVADPAPGPTERVERIKLSAALDDCLGLLSPDVRATVLLRFHTGLTYSDMAEPLDATAEALQVRVSRALPVLRRCMERKGWSGD